MNMRPVLFLDIDGVLNSTGFFQNRPIKNSRPNNMVDPEALKTLAKAVDGFDPIIVLSSTWRLGQTPRQMTSLFQHLGSDLKVSDRTPEINCMMNDHLPEHFWNCGRGLEIQWWLEHNLNPDELAQTPIVILDDDDDMGNDLRHRLVKTTFQTGLTEEHITAIREHLNKPLGKMAWTAQPNPDSVRIIK